MKIQWLPLFLVVFHVATMATPLLAESASATVVVPAGVMVEVDGVVYGSQSISVDSGSSVCLLNVSIALGLYSRETFSYWLHDGSYYSSSPCIDVVGDGVYKAVYTESYLVRVKTKPLVFTYVFWVKGSSYFNFTAPSTIVESNRRLEFSYWDEPYKFLDNTISALVTGPVSFTAVYKVYYPVRVNGETVGWLPSGSEYVFEASPRVSDGVMYKVESVKVEGSTSYNLVEPGVYVVAVEGPVNITPVYKKYYRVRVSSVSGNTSEWVEAGSEYTLDAPPYIEERGVRFVFDRWMGDVESDSSTYTFTVEKPVNVAAVYHKEYKVEVESPIGEKVYYTTEDGSAVIYVPDRLPGVVVGQRLDYFLVDGVKYEPSSPGLLVLSNVTKPLRVVAVYKYSVIWVNLAILIGFTTLVIGGYVMYESMREKRSGKE